jgi:hypothetical protein
MEADGEEKVDMVAVDLVDLVAVDLAAMER